MRQPIHSAKTFLLAHKTETVITAAALLILALLVAVFLYNRPKPTIVHVDYKAVNACDLFTPAKAEDLLGDHVINHGNAKPYLSGQNIATSKCGYTDVNPDQNQMRVAAVAVRSAINSAGIKQNKAEFAAAKAASGTQAVPNLGDDAYYNPQLGQLDILQGRIWMIVSYGVGATPEANSLDDALILAHKVLPAKS